MTSIIHRIRAAYRALFGAAAVAVVDTQAPPPAIRISQRAQWEAARGNGAVVTPYLTFAPAQPAPGVLPAGIAMDQAMSPPATSGWAESTAYHEGIGFLGYPYLAELAQRAEYRMIAEKWAEHATRRWIKLTGPDDAIKAIEAEMDRLRVRSVFNEAAELDGFFGRAQIFLDFGDANDPAELATPLIIDSRKIGPKRPLKALKVIEPVWSYPGRYDTSNPLTPSFYRPQNWYVYGKTVDASRMLTIVGREVPDLLKPSYAFGGLALSQMAKPYVDNWLRTRQSVSDMTHSFSTMVLKTNMGDTLAGGGGDDLFARVDMFNLTRDNRGAMVIDKNSEELENVAVPIAGLDKLQSQALEQLSSVSGVPLVILLGVTPSGLNASSDGEVRSFYAAVKAYQEKTFGEPLRRLIEVIQLSLFGAIDPEVKFEFEDLWEMSDKDKADIRKSDAEADAAYVQMGAVDPEEVRERLREDETSLYHGVDLSGPAPGPDDQLTDPEFLNGGKEVDPASPTTRGADGSGDPARAA